MREEASLQMFLKRMTRNYLEKEKIQVIYEEGKAPVEFVSKVEEYYCQFFLSSN